MPATRFICPNGKEWPIDDCKKEGNEIDGFYIWEDKK